MTSYDGNGMEMPNLTNSAEFGPLDPGNGLKGMSPVCQNPEELCHGKVNVIYCRFSSDMQRKESNENQAQSCREYLQRIGMDPRSFIVITDEEISGTRTDRPGWDRVKELMRKRRLGILIVFEVSRMDRGDNAVNIVRNIVFQDGRFLSATEYIDSDLAGWENQVRIASMHASGASGFTARRVYVAQSHLARTDDRSNGDVYYGVKSEFIDSAEERAASRQRHHRKRIVIDEAAADVVRKIFDWFVLGGLGISEIVVELVKLGDTIPIPGRDGKYVWNRDIIRRILANTKVKGMWVWGLTRTVRDSNGKKKHVKAKPEDVVHTARPHLKIVEPDLFDRAQVILETFKKRNGNKPGGGKRGPEAHFRVLHARTLIVGLIYCSGCGARLHVCGGKSGTLRLSCPNNYGAKLCSRTVGLLGRVAEAKVADAIGHALLADPAWLPTMMAKMTDAVANAAAEIPSERERLLAEIADVEKQIANAKKAITLGNGIEAIVELMTELQTKQRDLQGRLAVLKPMPDLRTLPTEAWVREQLADLPVLLKAGDPVMLGIIRSMIGRIEADEILAPGKKRGYARLRFTLDLPGVAEAFLLRGLPAGVKALLPPLATAEGRVEFTIDLGKPTRADELAAQIYAWRQESPPVPWKEICRRTGLHSSTAQNAYNRYRDNRGEEPLAA